MRDISRKLQIDLATQEINNSLDVLRAKGAGVCTKDDYQAK